MFVHFSDLFCDDAPDFIVVEITGGDVIYCTLGGSTLAFHPGSSQGIALPCRRSNKTLLLNMDYRVLFIILSRLLHGVQVSWVQFT
jgi:hypothetical protein